MDDSLTCECSEEYGPCGQHGTMLVVREGASLRTGDELTLQLIYDLADCNDQGIEEYLSLGAGLDAGAVSCVRQAEREMQEYRTQGVSGCGWLGPDLSEALREIADNCEIASSLIVFHDDGYRIVRIHADCPLYA